MVEEGQILAAEAYGPVITTTDSAMYFGATVGSNNTGELQAWTESASYFLSYPHLPEVTVFYESKWMASMVEGTSRPKRHKRMVHMSRLLLDKLQARTTVHWQWVKGHAGQEYNEMANKLADKGKIQEKA